MKLQEELMKQTIPELREFASYYGLKGYSKLKKQELVDVLVEEICHGDVVEGYAALFPRLLWSFFSSLAMGAMGRIPNEYGMDRVLLTLGFAFVKDNFLVMPDEICEKYRAFANERFEAQKSRQFLLEDYMQAAANLYGVIEQMELVRIFNMQNETKTDLSELIAVWDMPFAMGRSYAWKENYIVNEYYLMENADEDMEKLLLDTYDKPRYIPRMEKFLCYADPDYYEETPQLEALYSFLQKEYKLDDEDAFEIMDSFGIMISVGVDLEEYFRVLDSHDIVVERPEALVRHIAACADHARRWENKGYTQNEIRAMKQTVVRVGRNDPCPCGSGKKYKKCCGK